MQKQKEARINPRLFFSSIRYICPANSLFKKRREEARLQDARSAATET
jgi:hypothetical protein